MQFLPQLKCVQETHEVLVKWLLHWCTNTKDAPRCGHVAPSWVCSLLSLMACHVNVGWVARAPSVHIANSVKKSYSSLDVTMFISSDAMCCGIRYSHVGDICCAVIMGWVSPSACIRKGVFAMNVMMISAQWESSRHKTAHIGGWGGSSWSEWNEQSYLYNLSIQFKQKVKQLSSVKGSSWQSTCTQTSPSHYVNWPGHRSRVRS